MLKQHIQILLNKSFLTKDEAESAMSIILDDANPHQIAAFLTILKYRGETADEVSGMIAALQKRALTVGLPTPVLDIVGTGGDAANTVNISTGSSILAAACGVPIAKHGNRSVSSQSGSADVLEEFGIELEASPEQLPRYLDKVGIAFMYAPKYHPFLKKISAVRRGLKIPTVINMLGPLLNPAGAEYALIGVADEATLEIMSKVISQQSYRKRTLIFSGCGLDELTTLGKMTAKDIKNGQIESFEIDPVSFGFQQCQLKDLQGGNAQLNASILIKAFSGEKGPIADALILNAGAAIWIYGLTSTLKEGVDLARKVLSEGGALKVLDNWTTLSKSLQPTLKKDNYLSKILINKNREVELLIKETEENPNHPLLQILKAKHAPSTEFSKALKRPHLAVIGEVKRRSPSVGEIGQFDDPAELAFTYCMGGATAISVLTDQKGFGGSLNDLNLVSSKLASKYSLVPTLRKDFIIHRLQLAEAVLAGAKAVLLIANVLGNDLKEFIDESKRLGLEVLTEVHNVADLTLALSAGAEIIGINHRNLATFEIDLDISNTLRPLIPPHIITVAESGILGSSQAKRMRELGYDAILVGEALVRSEDPIKLIKQMQE